jgi:hypothetical protein
MNDSNERGGLAKHLAASARKVLRAEARRVDACFDDAHEPWGSSWGRLSDDQRRGALCEQVVVRLLGMDATENDALRGLQALARDLLKRQGLEGSVLLAVERNKGKP